MAAAYPPGNPASFAGWKLIGEAIAQSCKMLVRNLQSSRNDSRHKTQTNNLIRFLNTSKLAGVTG